MRKAASQPSSGLGVRRRRASARTARAAAMTGSWRRVWVRALDTRLLRGPVCRSLELTLSSEEPSPAVLAAQKSNPVFEPQHAPRAERVDLPPAGGAWLSRELRPCREHLSRLLRGIDIGSRTR
jgi:hypothetical protein